MGVPGITFAVEFFQRADFQPPKVLSKRIAD